MEETKVVKEKLKELKRCANMGILTSSVNKRDDIVTLKEVDKDIQKFQKARLAVLKEAKFNLLRALNNYDASIIKFNPEKIFENDYLALDLQDGDYKLHCLFGEHGVIETNNNDEVLLQRANIIAHEASTIVKFNQETNVLGNEFYDDTYLEISPLPFRILINGYGIVPEPLDLKNLGYSKQKREEIYRYFAKYYNGIFRKTIFEDDEVLDKYRTESKSKLLEKYRSMR